MTFKKVENGRTALMKFLVTPDEKAEIQALASRASLSPSDYMRRKSLGVVVREHDEALMLNELLQLRAAIRAWHDSGLVIPADSLNIIRDKIVAALDRVWTNR